MTVQVLGALVEIKDLGELGESKALGALFVKKSMLADIEEVMTKLTKNSFNKAQK